MKSINFEDKDKCEIFSENFKKICEKFFESKKIIAITGAGISVSSGIPVIKRNKY